ncbi:MAG: NrdJb [Halieaceae bacterium]|jgi:hypothetical protein|nr:NrdJb [Halieaceae bacterium]
MPKKIDQKIVDCTVVPKKADEDATQLEADIVYMHEKISRPESLLGSTYKVKTPLSDHALYITINDIILNPDTKHEQRRPFEIFINSKSMDHFQWVVALTRVISAVFRKGGDTTFLVEELKGVFDPKGGYFKRGGRFMPSLVAEIGEAIEDHMKVIGLIPEDKLDAHQKAFLDKKKQELAGNDGESIESDFPASAQLCSKCQTKALVFSDGCMTCLSCGDSKCG